jgi:hypothetical protein
MSLRRVALCAALLAALSAAPASAATFLRVVPSGALLTAGATVTSRSTGHETFVGPGGIGCSTQTRFTATVGASGGASVTGTLTSFTVQNCFDNVPGATITACFDVPSVRTRITFTPTAMVVDPLWLQCSAGLAGSCYYRGSTVTGRVASDSVGSAVWFGLPFGFGDVTVAHSVPTGVVDDLGASCGTAVGRFTTALTRLKTVSGTGVTVTSS